MWFPFYLSSFNVCENKWCIESPIVSQYLTCSGIESTRNNHHIAYWTNTELYLHGVKDEKLDDSDDYDMTTTRYLPLFLRLLLLLLLLWPCRSDAGMRCARDWCDPKAAQWHTGATLQLYRTVYLRAVWGTKYVVMIHDICPTRFTTILLILSYSCRESNALTYSRQVRIRDDAIGLLMTMTFQIMPCCQSLSLLLRTPDDKRQSLSLTVKSFSSL